MKSYDEKIQELEAEGLTTSDAQGVLQAKELKKKHKMKQIKENAKTPAEEGNKAAREDISHRALEKKRILNHLDAFKDFVIDSLEDGHRDEFEDDCTFLEASMDCFLDLLNDSYK